MAKFLAALSAVELPNPDWPTPAYLTVFKNGDEFPYETGAISGNGEEVKWSPLKDHLAMAGNDGIIVWARGLFGLELVPVSGGPFLGVTQSVEFSPDGQIMVVGGYMSGIGGGSIIVYARDGDNGYNHTQTIGGLGQTAFDKVSELHFNPAGTMLAVGANKVRIFDVAAGVFTENAAATAALVGANGSMDLVRGLRFSPDGTKLLVSNREAVKAYNVPAWTEIVTGMAGFDSSSIRWSPDGSMFAVSVHGGAVRIYSSAYALLQSINAPATTLFNGIDWSEDGETLYAYSHGGVDYYGVGICSINIDTMAISHITNVNSLGASYNKWVSAMEVAILPSVGPLEVTVEKNSSFNAIVSEIVYGDVNIVDISTPASNGSALGSEDDLSPSGAPYLYYTPTADFVGDDSFTYTGTDPEGTSAPATVIVHVVDSASMNCDCDCGYPTETFKSMQDRVAVEMGYASQLAALQSGVLLQIKNALNFAQRRVVEDITEIQAIRYFSWQLEDGVSKYCTTDNLETCRNQLRAARIYEAYIQNGAGHIITRLIKGIPYDLHSGGDLDRSTPSRYEVRSCIELWPVPTGGQDLKLVVLGQLAAVDMVADADTPSTTPDLIVMRAIAFLKSKKGHPDASDWMSQYRQTIGILNADGFIDERHIPNHVADRWAERLTHVMEPRIYLEP